MSVLITSDSTCDLSRELLEQYRIRTLPLYIRKGGEVFRDGVDITPADVIAHVDAGGDLCATAAINIGDYEDFFARVCAEADSVIHFCIGSGFSSCFQNARAAAGDYPNLTVVDSQNLSTGQGMQVLYAAMLAADGVGAEEILTQVEQRREKAECSFLLYRLDYMAKGGRCSAAAALGANLLHIRPCIEVTAGKMDMVKKYRGAYDKCIASYVRDRVSDRELDRSFAFVTHCNAEPAVVEAAQRALETYGQFDRVFTTNANCTVTCHCGPNCLGVLFFRA